MKITLDEIKSALKDESCRHALDPNSFRVDLPPVIAIPGQVGFNHGAKCLCGKAFEVVTQHSAKTPQGAMEFQAALMSDYAEHFRTAIAEVVYFLYEPKN
jgi:hypothetical protein